MVTTETPQLQYKCAETYSSGLSFFFNFKSKSLTCLTGCSVLQMVDAD